MLDHVHISERKNKVVNVKIVLCLTSYDCQWIEDTFVQVLMRKNKQYLSVYGVLCIYYLLYLGLSLKTVAPEQIEDIIKILGCH